MTESKLPEVSSHLTPEQGDVALLYQQGSAAYNSGNLQEAEACARDVIKAVPDWYAGYWLLMFALYSQRQIGGALDALVQASRYNPSSAEIWSNMGKVAREAGRMDIAETAYANALTLAPGDAGTRYSQSLLQLAVGDWANGWAGFERRFEGSDRAGIDRYPYDLPIWRGEEPPPGTTMIVLQEQGFGDTMMLLRYHPQLRQRFTRVIYELPGCLRDLAASSLSEAEIREPRSFDMKAQNSLVWQICTMSLPFCLGASAPPTESIPYLRARADSIENWRRMLEGVGQGHRFGLLWHSGKHTKLAGRDIPPEMLIPLKDLPGVHWFSLSNQPRPDALAPWVIDSRTLQTSFHETAALIHHLDLVVTVDTAVAHLAAAMGKPTWVLCRFEGDWRWGTRQRATAWYNSARVYYQAQPGEWSLVIERLIADLRAIG